MKRVTGIGGIFFKAKDAATLRAGILFFPQRAARAASH